VRLTLDIALSLVALFLWALALAYVPDQFLGMLLGSAVAASIVSNRDWISLKVFGNKDDDEPETARSHLIWTAITLAAIGLGSLFVGDIPAHVARLGGGFVAGATIAAIGRFFVLRAMAHERAARKAPKPGVFLE
jgi:hypothetical protein